MDVNSYAYHHPTPWDAHFQVASLPDLLGQLPLHPAAAGQQPGVSLRGGGLPLGDHRPHHPAHLWHWDGPDMRWGPIGVMGRDNEYVYRELLGLDEARYRVLEDDGHISLTYLDADGNPV